jgi:hypothetical protein
MTSKRHQLIADVIDETTIGMSRDINNDLMEPRQSIVTFEAPQIIVSTIPVEPIIT